MTSASGISHISAIHAAAGEDSVDVESLTAGCVVEVETKTRTYHVECLGGNSVRISGHPELCPTPEPARLQGAVSREGGLELGKITCGSRLMFFLNGNRPVNTSKVLKIRVTRPSADKAPSTIH